MNINTNQSIYNINCIKFLLRNIRLNYIKLQYFFKQLLFLQAQPYILIILLYFMLKFHHFKLN
jgi:hypothetical protein